MKRYPPSIPPDAEPHDERTILAAELREAHRMNRDLMRQLKKAQDAAKEAMRAHAKMVDTLTETMRENTILNLERDKWQQRAEHSERTRLEIEHLRALFGLENITNAEACAIRKAMARLHHPDSGGDPERMKAWNALLDRFEHEA
jgi:regulator of replication initiation timing